MTKKKLTLYVLLGSLIMFFCATAMNYMSASNSVANDVHRFFGSASTQNLLLDYINGEIEDIPSLHRQMTGNMPDVTTNTKPAFAYALVDKDGNVLFRSESGLWWSEEDENGEYHLKYASIEEYMTPEVKKQIMKIKRKSGHGNILVDEIFLNSSSGKDIPVSIVINDQKKHYTEVKLNDLPAERSVGKDPYLVHSWYFYDLDENSPLHKYYVKSNQQLDKAIAEYEYDGNEGGGGTCSAGELELHDVIGGYGLFTFANYNMFYETVTSDDFLAMTWMTFLFFAVATIGILIAAHMLYNKNQRLVHNRQVFISAAAHELKTPLSVIQNKCECIMEGINPEKDGQYVRDVYDEALRMNDIVKTLLLFNRVSNTDAVGKEKINFSEIATAETEKYQSFAASRGVDLTVEAEENIFINGNRELITLAVDNYLSNAVKYATGEKKAKVTLKREKSFFRFTVYNDCGGVSYSDNVWEVFAKADASRTSDGSSTGMGLPICKRIFDLHSFSYNYRNVKGGVVFSFSGKALK